MIVPPAHRGDNWAMTERALLIKQFTTPQAKVAVTWSGTLPYFADRYAIDLLGKNDSNVARRRVARRRLYTVGNGVHRH